MHTRHRRQHGANRLKGLSAVYLGCTELPLAFPAYKHVGVFDVDGVRYVNSTALHIQAAFEYAIAGSLAAVWPMEAKRESSNARVVTAKTSSPDLRVNDDTARRYTRDYGRA